MTSDVKEGAKSNIGNELCFDELVIRFSHETERMLAGLRSIVRMANKVGEDLSEGRRHIRHSTIPRSGGTT